MCMYFSVVDGEVNCEIIPTGDMDMLSQEIEKERQVWKLLLQE